MYVLRKLWYDELSKKLLLCDIIRKICHNDFKRGSINFLKQKKQSVKYQKLCNAALNNRI